MMHVCLHESFSVNYACIFAVHQTKGKSLGDVEERARQRNTVRKDAHSPLAAWESCHIYESKRYRQVSQTSGMHWPGLRTGDCRASAS